MLRVVAVVATAVAAVTKLGAARSSSGSDSIRPQKLMTVSTWWKSAVATCCCCCCGCPMVILLLKVVTFAAVIAAVRVGPDRLNCHHYCCCLARLTCHLAITATYY